jgi:hypothetical protein
MSAYERDFDWQRGLIPEIKRILANYLIAEAPAAEDMQHNTDLIVLRLDTVRVACRIRRYEYLATYGDQFTIRASRPSGADTELAKVLSGWGDYLFYGFASADAAEFAAWMLGDLSTFRLWHHRQLYKRRDPGEVRRNGDGSSNFVAYRIDDLPDEFVVSRMRTPKVAA